MSDEYIAAPLSVLDYSIDWGTWLAEGETLTASTWTVQTGITQTTPAPSFTAGGVATIWLTGGTVGNNYKVTNRITTSAGRQHQDSLHVYVNDT